MCEPEEIGSCPADCGVPGNCTDSDGGLVYDVRGTVIQVGNGQYSTATDTCVDAERLTEYFCNRANQIRYVEKNCSNMNGTYIGCSNGACY
ncbi:hypothetical protein D6789_02715 [Candidatus Woesearchaeota archaeon]|nr:MAG: hypothetical protein D6789_02715 [Candidatus Woesearchaeota archaeon]